MEQKNKIDIMSLTIDELAKEIVAIGEKSFRAKQIFAWLHAKSITAFDEMTDLSMILRQNLAELFFIKTCETLEIQKSLVDNTRKYLFDLSNNIIIESVLMEYEYGSTVCVSSQAGCRMGCSFCASQINGLAGNLSASDMLSQVYAVERELGRRVSRCVVMGQGEPFDNFDNTMKFIDILNSKDGHNMGMRNITVSTSGLIPEIERFTSMMTQVNLAVSLHAPNDEIRTRLMPIAKKYRFDDLINACVKYTKKTKRRITFEYALIDGINDKKEHAKELSEVLKNILCHVNLIPVNEVSDLRLKKSNASMEFSKILQKNGINSTIRRTLGEDIDGACGQLRNSRTSIDG